MAFWGEVELIQNWQSIEGNYSNVTANYYACTDYGTSWSNYTTYPYLGLYYGATADEETQTLSSFNFGNSKRILIGSMNRNIPHNADGTMSISASFTWNSNHNSVGTITGSNSLTLTTIPRASTPSVSGTMNLGNSVTIYTNRASSSFTHSVYAYFGNKYVIIGENIGSSVSWIIPKNFADCIPNSTNGTGTLYCDTFNNGSYIGTKSISFTAYIPNTAEFKPKISSVTLSEAIEGLTEQFGCYVQNKSKIHCVVSGEGAYSSVINACKVTINGVIYNTHDFTTNFLSMSGENVYSVTITDSRGRTASTSGTFTVVKYSQPKISTFTVVRCDNEGNENEEGEFAKVVIDGSISDVNSKNTHSYTLQYKKDSETEYTDYPLEIDDYSINEIITDIPVDVDNSFDFLMTISDYFSTSTKEVTIGTGYSLVNYNASGKGIAFGKVSEKDAFEVKMDVEVSGNLAIKNMKYYKGSCNDILETSVVYVNGGTDCPSELEGVNYGFLFTKRSTDNYMVQIFEDVNSNRSWKRTKSGGTWGSWQRQAIIQDVKWIFGNPLTYANISLYDGDIKRSKFLIVYYTFMADSAPYRQSITIPIGDPEWYIVHYHEGAIGYIKTNVNNTSELIVSNYSNNTFRILGYSCVM